MRRHRCCLIALVLFAIGPALAPVQTLPVPQSAPAAPIDTALPGGVVVGSLGGAQPILGPAPVVIGAPLPGPIPGPVGPILGPGPMFVEPQCPPCGLPGRFWFGADYLFWFVQGNPTPPLVTTGPASTPLSQLTGLDIAHGGERLNGGVQSGFRLRGGVWLDSCHLYGIEGSFYYLIPDKSDYSLDSDESVAARPFFNLNTGLQDAVLVRFPDAVQGDVEVRSRTSILGGSAALSYELFCCDNESYADPCNPGCHPAAPAGFGRLDFLFGYRYFRLSDRLAIDQSMLVLDSALLGSGFPDGSNLLLRDYFYTRNDYHAVDLALNYRWRRERFQLNVRPALGLGWLKAVTSNFGYTDITVPGQATRQVAGGLLTQPTNIGTFHSQQFAWMPALELNAGYQVNQYLLVQFGWSAQYFSKVLRAGDQIDPILNPSQFAGGTQVGEDRPLYPRNFTDLWVTGFNVGCEVRY